MSIKNPIQLDISAIAIGADHRGFELKKILMKHHDFGDHKVKWIDCGTFTDKRTDYPIYTTEVIQNMKDNIANLGLLICGSGTGMAIAANRNPGIYAAVVWNEEVTKMSKEDDNINVLVLPADFVTSEKAISFVKIWLSTKFKKDRYQLRLNMIDNQKRP